MENAAAAVLSPEDLEEVYHGFKHQVWALGANVIVGWRPVPFGLQILYLPSVVLKKAAKTYPQLLDPARHIDNERKLARLTKVGCTVTEISLHFDFPDGAEVIRQINDITRRGALDAKRDPPAKPKPKLQPEPEPVFEPTPSADVRKRGHETAQCIVDHRRQHVLVGAEPARFIDRDRGGKKR